MFERAQSSLEFGMGADNLRVAILSDTHGYLDPRVLAVTAHCDAVVHAGDICGSSVLTTLQKASPRIYPVAGNNDAGTLWSDRPVGSDILPSFYEINLPGGVLAVEHGDRFGGKPSHDELRNAWPDARGIVYGHTHVQVVDQSDDPWVLNPGAAGQTRVEQGPSCLVLTISDAYDWSVEAMRFSLQEKKVA